jgi:hypothetical protein
MSHNQEINGTGHEKYTLGQKLTAATLGLLGVAGLAACASPEAKAAPGGSETVATAKITPGSAQTNESISKVERDPKSLKELSDIYTVPPEIQKDLGLELPEYYALGPDERLDFAIWLMKHPSSLVQETGVGTYIVPKFAADTQKIANTLVPASKDNTPEQIQAQVQFAFHYAIEQNKVNESADSSENDPVLATKALDLVFANAPYATTTDNSVSSEYAFFAGPDGVFSKLSESHMPGMILEKETLVSSTGVQESTNANGEVIYTTSITTSIEDVNTGSISNSTISLKLDTASSGVSVWRITNFKYVH